MPGVKELAACGIHTADAMFMEVWFYLLYTLVVI